MLGTQYSYDLATGEILTVLTGHLESVSLNHGDGVVVDLIPPANVDNALQYHKDGSIADRPELMLPETAIVGEAYVIAPAPAASKITVDGDQIGTSDGSDIELIFDLDGKYEVSIDPPFPYVAAKMKVVVIWL